MSFGAIYHNYYDNQAYGRQDGRAGAGRTNADPIPVEDVEGPDSKVVTEDDHPDARAIRLAERMSELL
jgi:hypothetical protein